MALTKISKDIVAINAIQGTLIADNAITAVHIATNAVSGTLIADNAVTATHIAQNVITVTQLADDAVEADKIADGVITTNHLNKAMISSQTEVAVATGDFILLGDTSDSNNLKKAPISSILAGTLTTAAQTNITSLGTLTTLTVDDITINGSTISDSGDFTLDVGGDISLSADDNGEVHFYDGSLHYGSILEDNSNLIIQSIVQDEDILFKGDDGGSVITALTLDMSKAGAATFNSTINDLTLSAGEITTDAANNFRLNTPNSMRINIDSDGNSSGEVFQIGHDQTAINDSNVLFRVQENGNVGIGTTAPNTKFQVNDGTNLNINVGSLGSVASVYSMNDAGNAYAAMRIDAGGVGLLLNSYSGGKVGIGTAGPAAKLDVRDGGGSSDPTLSLVSNTSTAYNHSINALNPNLTAGEANIIVVGSAGSTNNSGYLGFKYASAGSNDNLISLGHWGNNFQLNITGDGNVGIGTESPGGSLHIHKTGGNNTVLLTNNTNTAGTYTDLKWAYATSGEYGSGLRFKQVDTSHGGQLEFFTDNTSGTYTQRMTLTEDGYLWLRNTTASYDGGQFQMTSASTCQTMYVSNTGFADPQVVMGVERGASSAYKFFNMYSGRRPDNGGGDVEFQIRGDGNGYCDGSWSGGGADYAEYFEWSDGNGSSQDRIGLSVVLVNNKIREATGSDAAGTIIGVISGNPAVVGDTAYTKWTDKYQKDDYGRYVLDSDGHRQENSDYNDSLTYVERENRKEWDTVGLMGKLRMKKGQQTGTNWIKMRDISASVEEWLVR